MTDPYPNGINTDIGTLRNTTQFIIPAEKAQTTQQGYDIYPAFKIADTIYSGFNSLAEWIVNQDQNIVIDGYSGVCWDQFVKQLHQHLTQKGKTVRWITIDTALKPATVIEELIAVNLQQNDPVFGKRYEGELIDYFDLKKLRLIQPDSHELTIIYGCGAALAPIHAKTIYIDVPKNEIQFRSRANVLRNLGASETADPKTQYKRFYFVDWPVLNKHKQQLLARIDAIVDEQRIIEIAWMTGAALRNSLTKMSRHAFRARPWFEPGVWGGQWIKDNIAGLNPDVINYAWSFELIAPENGIVLENEGRLLEVSFDSLLFHNSNAILGKAAKRFGYHFPIRFDFLDTMNGAPLSLQCHPTIAYTKEHFGEDFTQDETYYILEHQQQAKVYLGFQENIDPQEFKRVLQDSFNHHTPVAVETYVQTFNSKKHELYLIPNGTVHSSGKNNLVLEISATPYIFTFKMYDWLRPDLNGKPRPLNIERAFANLNFERKGDVVKDTLIAKQSIIKQGDDWQVINLMTHPDHFYAIHRFEFDTVIEGHTNGQCHILSLVEGDLILVRTGQMEQVIHYAETFIIPADAVQYQIINKGKGRAKVLTAFVKDECC